MSLHEVYEITDIDTPFYYEYFDHNDKCVHILEYNPEEQFTRGADNVLAIEAGILPEIGVAIICVLE